MSVLFLGDFYGFSKFGLLTEFLQNSIVMIGTLTGLQWMIYDSFKIFMGLPTTGGAPPPAEEKAKA